MNISDIIVHHCLNYLAPDICENANSHMKEKKWNPVVSDYFKYIAPSMCEKTYSLRKISDIVVPDYIN